MKRIYTVALFVLALGLVVSCAAYKPPKIYQFDKTQTINKSFDEVWGKIIQWFGNNNSPIKTIEKASGLIATEYHLKADMIKQSVDCGESGFGQMVQTSEIVGNFNIVVAKISENSTRVTINTFFSSIRLDANFAGGPDYRSKISCNSKGYLEKEIFDYLSK